jgi:hypothetical protein
MAKASSHRHGLPRLIKLAAQRQGRDTLYALELTIEIRVVSKSNTKSNFEHTQITVCEELGGRSDSKLVDVRCHCPSCGTPEEPTESRLAHVHRACEFREIDLLIEALMEMRTYLIDSPLVFNVAKR